MQHIADWLESLGMSEYAQRFAENGIDLSVLPDLTDQDLKELGVLLGDRRKILRAIAKLDATSETANSTLTVAAVQPVAIAQGPSERRRVTVMLCELVDFDAEVRIEAEEVLEPLHRQSAGYRASTTEEMPPREEKRPVTVILFGRQAAAQSRRIRLTAFS